MNEISVKKCEHSAFMLCKITIIIVINIYIPINNKSIFYITHSFYTQFILIQKLSVPQNFFRYEILS